MDPAIKSVFAIGVVAAAATGVFGWTQGWLPSFGTSDAPRSAAVSPVEPKPGAPVQGAPKPQEDRSAARTPDAELPKAGEGAATPPAGAGPAPRAPDGSAAALPEVAPAPKQPAPSDKGAFDIVRVEPSGEIVVAGRCPAGCTAELTANGRTQDTAKADASGNFAMEPPSLPPGDHQLGLTVTTPDGRRETSEQTVTVSVPAAPSKEVVVVLNDPDEPSKILQKPGQQPAAAKAAETAGLDPNAAKTPAQKISRLSLMAVDAEKGRFFVQGSAPEGARLRVYLNEAAIADAVAGADERWSLRVERGLTAGKYVVRVDQIDAAGKVATRVEQAFEYEAEPQVAAAEPRVAPKPENAPAATSKEPTARTDAQASPQAATRAPARAENPTAAAGEGTVAAPPATGAAPLLGRAAEAPASGAQGAAAPAGPADTANPVVASIDTAKVKRGDSLWRISRITYGRGQRYTMIFTANDAQIRNPNLIYPGQVLVLPQDDAAKAAGEAARR